MKNFEMISFDFFTTVLQILEYMNSSSERLLVLLDKCEPQDREEYIQKDGYEKLLNSIKTKAEKIKSEMLSSTMQQIQLIDQKQIHKKWFEELDEELRQLSNITKSLGSPQLYVDNEGNLRTKS